MAYDFKKLEEKISGIAKHFEEEIASLRTGRATPAILENIRVEAYGSSNSLKNVASIITEDARTLLVQPWDKALMEKLAKALESSNLGSQPIVTKDFIRISVPPLTEERRKSLQKVVKEKLEEAKISLRKGRDEVWKDIQEKEKNKTISENEKFRLKDQMEEKVKKGVEKLEELATRKEKEILE
ncbi:ribosome recycling factor [Candidatus Giovannonibacteria bacterium]|nr:ribosome recycling factor [Candidatus Giovannonibacteria bacterium]